jgi:hypothetical protein
MGILLVRYYTHIPSFVIVLSANKMLLNKLLLASGTKSSSHMTVTFQIEDKNEFVKEINSN